MVCYWRCKFLVTLIVLTFLKVSLFNPMLLWILNICFALKGMAGEGNGTPLQYSCLENPMDGGAWKAAVHGVTEHRTRLSDFPFTFYFYALEKEMETHSSVLAWRIPGTGEPGGLPSMGSHRVRHDWSDLAAAAAKGMAASLSPACYLILVKESFNINWTRVK